MNILYNGFDTQEVTFRADTAVLPKRAVALQSTGEVYYANAGGAFTGIVSSYRDGLVSVIMRGYAVANYRNTAPTVGICKLSIGISGQFEVDETNGKPYTVVGVDPTTKSFEFFL